MRHSIPISTSACLMPQPLGLMLPEEQKWLLPRWRYSGRMVLANIGLMPRLMQRMQQHLGLRSRGACQYCCCWAIVTRP